MSKHRTLFVTKRAPLHQCNALAAAPPELEIILCASPSREELLSLLPDAEILISERSGVVDEEMIAAGKRLRLIQRLGSLTYDIDVEAARRAGVPVCYWPISSCIHVAEHTLMLMLTLARRLPDLAHVALSASDWGTPPRECDANTFAYNWSGRRNLRTVSGGTVGILGMGEIGSELARRLRSLDCTVLYHKRTRLPGAAEEDLGVQYVALDELQARSDFLCCLLPHSEETAHIIDAAFISRMKPGAFLISTGTSTALNEGEVAEAVRQGKLAGLATDGYCWEPIRPDNPLLPLARDPSCNVVLTPHVAAGQNSAHPSARMQDYTNVVRLLADQPLLHRVV